MSSAAVIVGITTPNSPSVLNVFYLLEWLSEQQLLLILVMMSYAWVSPFFSWGLGAGSVGPAPNGLIMFHHQCMANLEGRILSFANVRLVCAQQSHPDCCSEFCNIRIDPS